MVGLMIFPISGCCAETVTMMSIGHGRVRQRKGRRKRCGGGASGSLT